jgi:glycosyltransferase involved in cell wall biosynthesis
MIKIRCTILMPVYNGMPYIKDSLQSLLNQTSKEITIFILNDGSNDGTGDYLSSVSDERVRVFHLPRLGLTEALNNAMHNVTTEYVARMDADDISHQQRFEKQIRFMDENPNCVLLGTWVRYISENRLNRSWDIKMPVSSKAILSRLKKRQSAIVNSSTFARTKAIQSVGGHNGASFPAEDYDLFIRLSKIGELANLPEVLLEVRIHKMSIITNKFWTSLKKYTESIQRNYGISYYSLKKYYLFFDALSAIIYRKGLFYYLNGMKIAGYIYFLCSIVINPVRLAFFISSRLKSLEL